MRRPSLAVAVALACVACGSHPPTSPSTPAQPSTGGSGGSAPVAAIQLNADASGSRDAIAALSEVVVDASGSSGANLTFAIDFGDGATAETASAKHVYTAPATYTVTATVTDGQARKAAATAQITVRDATGNWFHAAYVQKHQQVEVRRLSIEAQSGTTVRGSYRVTGDVVRSFTGTLIAPRDIRMTIDGGVSLAGTLPGRLNDDTVPLTLISTGDSLDGQRLDFRAITGAADGILPEAAMKVSWDDPLAWPLASISPVKIDGGGSRGTSLSYFLEFGDGFVATTPQATHVLDTPFRRMLTARVTVVDRFGRSSERSFDYRDFEMAAGDNVAERDYWMDGNLGDSLAVEFMTRTGRNYVGQARFPTLSAPPTRALATLSEGAHIHIVLPDQGITYEGTVKMSYQLNMVMTVVQHGGRLDGKTWVLNRTSYY